MPDATLGLNLLRLRLAVGLTQAQLAEKVGMSRTSITNIETGRQSTGWANVCLLADALGASLGRVPEARVMNALCRQGVSGCTCYFGDRGRETTVGCRVHHVMPDGCIAADHEVACEGCGEFLCDHECAWYDEIDPDVPEDDCGETFCCPECGAFGVKQGTLRLNEADAA